jgi:hypothetical protein
MLKPIAYIETTIPSFYHEVRTWPDIIARRDWTHSWWGIAQGRYRLVTSEAVIHELEGGIQIATPLELLGAIDASEGTE